MCAGGMKKEEMGKKFVYTQFFSTILTISSQKLSCHSFNPFKFLITYTTMGAELLRTWGLVSHEFIVHFQVSYILSFSLS